MNRDTLRGFASRLLKWSPSGRPAPGGGVARPRRAEGERLVFVGGAPRSGTTLLQHVLDSHPDVFGGPEFDCVPTLIETWRQVKASLECGRITVFCCREQIDAAFARLIEDLLLPAADAAGARLLSEKTPLNALYFAELLAMMPRCRAIHVVRDPRAVVASLLNVGSRGKARGEPVPPTTTDVLAAIPFVRAAVDGGCYAQYLYPQRVLTVTYEALVGQPESTISRACDFLGVRFDPRMLAPHAQQHPGLGAIVQLDGGVWQDPKLGHRAIETTRIDVWRRDLGADQLTQVNAAFRDHPGYRALGYLFE
jgi:protein-tyrosine sulfotransferase